MTLKVVTNLSKIVYLSVDSIIMKNLIVLFTFLSFLACSKKTADINLIKNNASPEIEQIYSQLSGHYKSLDKTDIDSIYQKLEYHIIPIQFNTGDRDYWLYAEQYSSETPDDKKIQTLYKLKQLTDMIGLERYNLDKWSKEISYNNLDVLKNIDPQEIKKQRGCTVYLRTKENNTFLGSTLLKNCTNRYKGSMFSRLEMKITDDQLMYLEQGFDEYDRYIWGPKKKGIKFVKLK